MNRTSLLSLALTFSLAACTSTTPESRRTPFEASSQPVASSSPSASTSRTPVVASRTPGPADYRPVPTLIVASEGLVFPAPRGWFAHDESNREGGSRWDLVDHDPSMERRSGLGISIGTGRVDAEARRNVSRCPKRIEETRIITCGFVQFHGRRWRRLVGVSDTQFVNYKIGVGESIITITGFPVRAGAAGRKPLDAIIQRAFVAPRPGYVLAVPGRVRPGYEGDNGAAGICGDTPGQIAEYSLEIDTPMPRCSVVHPRQRLRIVNNRPELIVARLGNLVMFLPPRSAVTVREPFEQYLQPGGHSVRVSAVGGGPELRLRAS